MTDKIELKKTPLYDFHIQNGAKMVPFAGYAMPVQYAKGILAEHKWTREKAGLFDVSHMGVVKLSGDKIGEGLEALCPIDIGALPVGKQKYSYFTNELGGIIDDIMVSNYGDFLIVVVNAGRKVGDVALMKEKLAGFGKVEFLADYALLALQGPKARAAISSVCADVADMKFMEVKQVNILGEECFVSCSGYTGEDGYEIAIPAAKAQELVDKLLLNPDVALIGLGARDTLRLEAGLCLYGQDIDEDTTPAEAGITFAITKRRREQGGFPGADVIMGQIKNGTNVKLVGLLPKSRAPVRAHSEVLGSDGNKIGMITSGSFGATVGAPIALAMVDDAYAAVGAKVLIDIRGNMVEAEVVALPFVAHNYKR